MWFHKLSPGPSDSFYLFIGYFLPFLFFSYEQISGTVFRIFVIIIIVTLTVILNHYFAIPSSDMLLLLYFHVFQILFVCIFFTKFHDYTI